MHWRIQQRGAITFAFFFSVIALRADISLPTAAPSPPPQADDHALRLWRGDRATIPLRGHHSGSGTVTFWIVDPPAHGTLSELRLLGDNRATIVYQNHGAEPAANDRFTYLVRTSGNRVSSVAEVKIVVDEPPPHLQAPGRIEFDQIVAGESRTGNYKSPTTAAACWRDDSPSPCRGSSRPPTIGSPRAGQPRLA
ncbi:MAG: hypothetical protein M3429_11625 [Verrucomicrobiota bacterium]|nr:hypothetical protein [Verrucomicrobiota bacterium]